VDITQTGETLRQNGLVEIDKIADVSSRLVVNRARLKLDGKRLGKLISDLETALARASLATA
jgi:ATP phosphoribosyltransferase